MVGPISAMNSRSGRWAHPTKGYNMKIENVDVVATLLAQGRKILAIYNPRWGAFTLPMSRRKQFNDPDVSKAIQPEDLERAAARVAAEVLGRTFAPEDFPKPLCEIKDFEQSDADGVWKLYQVHVFGLKLSEGVQLAPGVIAEWMPAIEFRIREPITRTARFILKRLEEQDQLPPWAK